MTQRQIFRRERREWRTVRIPVELIDPVEELVRNRKDAFGMPVFRSKSDVVTRAVQEFLKKYSEEHADI